MANVSQKTLHWLYSVLTKEYQDLNRTYSDLAYTLERFPTISPRTDVYTFENGVSALLVHLVGTLPVSFRNITYRFPIELWIPHTYPYQAPIVYVIPTREMVVRPGRHISGEGRVYHPCLAHWAETWNRISIVELLSTLCDVFSREPPVISRQQPGTLAPQPTRPPPLPPHPQDQPRDRLSTAAGSISEREPPAPPPKQQLEADADGISQPRKLGRYDGPPPLPEAAASSSTQPSQNVYPGSPTQSSQFSPPKDVSAQGLQSIRREQHFDVPSTSQGAGGGMPYPATPMASSQQQPSQPSSIQAPPPPGENSYPQPFLPHQSLSMEPDSAAPPYLQQARNVPLVYQQNQPQPNPPSQPKPPPVDLLDSPFDLNLPVSSSANIPVPPVPPNPEKDALLSALSQAITQTLHHEISTNTASLPLLRSQNDALKNSLRTLDSEVSQLQTLQTTLTGNISILHNSLREADQCIASAGTRAQRGDIPAIDDMLVAPTVVGKQLYDVVCELRGIEAAIWALQAALTRGRIGVDVWARKTRELSREAFQRKVVMGKIKRGIGLDGD